MRAFYTTFHKHLEDGGTYEEFEARAAQDFGRKLDLIRERVPLPARILDVGCGKGEFLLAAKECGFDVAGIDVSETGVKHARDRLRAIVRLGQLEGQDDWQGCFVAACLWATMEHVPDPRALLSAVHRALKPEGILLVDTGIAGDLCDRWAPGSTQWYHAPEHLWVFSKQGLTRTIEAAGFTIEYVDCCFDRSVARKVVRRLRNSCASAAGYMFWRLLLGARGVGRLRLDAKLPYGNLMLIVARRRPI